MRRNVKASWIGVAIAMGVALAPGVARADVSSWAYAGAGALALKEGDDPLVPRVAMSFDFGMGTSPDGPFVIGGLARWTPVFGLGSDVSLLARFATRGFQAGGFGLAIDAGGYQRFWGARSRGFSGSLTLGLPLGFSVGMHGLYGTEGGVAVGGMIGIDFARLTVYRQVLLDTWPNPFPAQRAPAAAAHGQPLSFF